MAIAALVAWVLTALGGFLMLARWISHGGLGQQHDGATRFPAGLVFTHLGLAAAGLVLWIIYLLTDVHRLAWVAFVLLVPVALLGFTMLARWIPTRRPVAVGTRANLPEPSPNPIRPNDTYPFRSSLPTAPSPWPPSCLCS